MRKETKEATARLRACGLRPSVQRVSILAQLISRHDHPTVEDVYKSLCDEIPTLSKTTVYNTLRMLAENHVAQMITVDDHRVCYDGDIRPHVHFMCRKCGRIIDLMDEPAPAVSNGQATVGDNIVDEAQLYYKGVCGKCLAKEKRASKKMEQGDNGETPADELAQTGGYAPIVECERKASCIAKNVQDGSAVQWNL